MKCEACDEELTEETVHYDSQGVPLCEDDYKELLVDIED